MLLIERRQQRTLLRTEQTEARQARIRNRLFRMDRQLRRPSRQLSAGEIAQLQQRMAVARTIMRDIERFLAGLVIARERIT